MAIYRVPQDVEAEDKIIGFLSLKQLIFVIMMVASLYMCYLLAQIQIILGVLPLPIAVVTGVLGLYQRNDQPIEIFLASYIRHKLMPRKRIWNQEGYEERVVITVPKHIDKYYTNSLNPDQVNSRLKQLSTLMDSRGWASKNNTPSTTMVADQRSNSFVDSQRLFSTQELRQFSGPASQLETDATTEIDVYDDDPRNNTIKEVTKDLDSASKNKRSEALKVIEQARKERPINEPSGQPLPIASQRPPQQQTPTPVITISPQNKTAKKRVETKEPPAVIASPKKNDSDEVTIQIKHSK